MRLVRWFFRPAVLALIGVTALALIVWFQAPYLAFNEVEPFESATNRWVVIAILFLVWALYFGLKWYAARRASKLLMQGVGAEDQPPPDSTRQQSEQEVAQLTLRMNTALESLRNSRGSKRFGQQYLYQIPWYMFVGAPGSGKTTALVHSGLKFPLSKTVGAASIGGVGGTRNCDWWFTDDAVLLDTAGRYTTQDSHSEVDKAAWQGFLDLLKKHRRRRPINGVIFAVSVADLLQQNESARSVHARTVRARIKELHDRLEIEIPIYVMVTKCDLLAGFIEYFEDLGKEGREQVWGVTFSDALSANTDASLQSLGAEFESLEQRLNERMLPQLQRERDLARRSLMYRFPQQFASLTAVLAPFLTEVFQSSRYEKASLLRGVYFTSGTQEGSPIDRVLAALAGTFGITRQLLPAGRSGGRSYFISRLLRDVIFNEAGIAGTDQRFERSRLWVGRGAMIATALVVLIGTGLLFNSYWQNKIYVSQVTTYSAQLEELARQPASSGTAIELVPFLNALRDIPGGFSSQRAGEGPVFEFGLSQRDKLGSQAVDLYQRALSLTLLPRVVEQLEARLSLGSASNLDYLYEVLHTYLMLGNISHYDSGSVVALVEYEFEQRTAAARSKTDSSDLRDHLRTLLTDPQVDRLVATDAVLVDRARLALARLPVDSRIYSRLKRNLLQSRLAEFTASETGGPDAVTVLVRRSGAPLTRGVPGFFTKAGYEAFEKQRDDAIKEITNDSWVLGDQEALSGKTASSTLTAAIDSRYFDDYIRSWDDFLADLGVRELESLNEGARLLNILSGPDSPLRLVLEAAAEQTTFGQARGLAAGARAPDIVQDRIDNLKSRLAGVVGTSTDTSVNSSSTDKQLHPVDRHFQRLHRLVKSSKEGAPVPLDQLLTALREVSVFMDAAFSAKRQGAPAPPADALIRLKRDAQGLPSPVGAVMQDVANAGSGLTLGNEKERLNALWRSSVAPFCEQALQGRYPMTRGAQREVTHDDFGRLFAPGGLIDDFFQKNLAAFVDMSRSQWRMRPGSDISLGVSSAVIRQFQRAAQIRDTFFVPGARSASVRFELVPVSMDSLLSQFRIDIDGQVLTYSHGPTLPATFQWPTGSGTSLVRAEFSPPAGNGSTMISAEGPWALFRMLDRALLTPTAQREKYRLSFRHEGRRVDLELRAGSVANPFDRRMLESFQCPASL